MLIWLSPNLVSIDMAILYEVLGSKPSKVYLFNSGFNRIWLGDEVGLPVYKKESNK